MFVDNISQASRPEFMYGAFHHQGPGFLAGFLYGAMLRSMF